VVVAAQLSVDGLYRPPVSRELQPFASQKLPPQRTAELPVQTAVEPARGEGAPTLDIEDQTFATGSYRPPVPNVVQMLPSQV
jgi:hypothetical protein